MNTLPAATAISQVTLRTRRVAQLSTFYQAIVGLQEISTSEDAVRLSASGQEPAQLILIQDETAKPLNRRQPGLYHVAWLVPNRQELARVLQHLQETTWPLQGLSDHLVSEAIYLADPDGNGIEIYADRPRNTWPIENGQVQMASIPVNIPELLSLIKTDNSPWTGLHYDTKIGHIHLQVSSLTAAKNFYSNIMGFQVMQESYPGALFVAAGGYHHHIGLNIWHSQNATASSEKQTGLVNFTIQLPDAEVLQALQDRLEAANFTTKKIDADTFETYDSDQILIRCKREIN